MCRPPAMSADRPAASDGGPVVSHTRHPVGDRFPPLRSQQVFRYGAGDPATARHFTCPSARDVDRLSSGVEWGEVVIPGPSSGGRWLLCFPGRAPPYPPPSRFWRATARYVDHPQAAMGSRHRSGTAPGPAGDCPPPSPPAIQLQSRM